MNKGVFELQGAPSWLAFHEPPPDRPPGTSASRTESLSNRRPRVLLADDHPLVVERVTAALQHACDIVATVGDGRSLVHEALRLTPDVIVLDITMPHLTGVEAAREIRELGLSCKFVFLTVHQEQAFLNACLAEGAVGYVTKPRLTSDLLTAVRYALSDRQFISPFGSRN
jgi:DNA-binding NarL/FixJ family response regulator